MKQQEDPPSQKLQPFNFLPFLQSGKKNEKGKCAYLSFWIKSPMTQNSYKFICNVSKHHSYIWIFMYTILIHLYRNFMFNISISV